MGAPEFLKYCNDKNPHLISVAVNKVDAGKGDARLKQSKLESRKNASKSKHRKFFSAHKRTQIAASTMFVLNKISV